MILITNGKSHLTSAVLMDSADLFNRDFKIRRKDITAIKVIKHEMNHFSWWKNFQSNETIDWEDIANLRIVCKNGMIEEDEKNLEDPHDDQQEESRILEKETKKADEWLWLSIEAKMWIVMVEQIFIWYKTV